MNNNNLNRDAEGPGNDDADHCGEAPALNVQVLPFGPDQARIDQAVSALLAHPLVRELTIPGEYRLLNFGLEQEGEAADCTGRADKRAEPCPPDRFVATVYDYAENRVIEIRGAAPRARSACSRNGGSARAGPSAAADRGRICRCG